MPVRQPTFPTRSSPRGPRLSAPGARRSSGPCRQGPALRRSSRFSALVPRRDMGHTPADGQGPSAPRPLVERATRRCRRRRSVRRRTHRRAASERGAVLAHQLADVGQERHDVDVFAGSPRPKNERKLSRRLCPADGSITLAARRCVSEKWSPPSRGGLRLGFHVVACMRTASRCSSSASCATIGPVVRAGDRSHPVDHRRGRHRPSLCPVPRTWYPLRSLRLGRPCSD